MGCAPSSKNLEEKIKTVEKFIKYGFYESGWNLARKCLSEFNPDNLEDFSSFKLCMSLLRAMNILDEKWENAEKVKISLIEWYLTNFHRKIFFSKNKYLYNEKKQIFSLSAIQNLKKICVELLKITYSPFIHKLSTK